MIKILKLQKAVIAIVLGIICMVAYFILTDEKYEAHKYLLEVSGVLFILGALMFLYPIVFSKKDKAGCVELDPEVDVDAPSSEPAPLADSE